MGGWGGGGSRWNSLDPPLESAIRGLWWHNVRVSVIFLSSAAYSLPLDCGNALMFECCLTLPPLLFQAQLLITPLAASYGKKNYCNLRIPWIIASLVWTLVLAALYTLSFTFLSAIIGWSDWANPFSFWHSLCCQRYSGSCSGKLTRKFP